MTFHNLKGKLFSGEFREQSTGTMRKFGGVLLSIDGNMITFKGKYKTFVLDIRTIASYSYRDVEVHDAPG